MGSKRRDVVQSFTNNAGGLNLAISSKQANSNEAVVSFDVFYKSYGAFGSISKRKGRKLLRTLAESYSVDHFTQFTIGTSTYTQYVTKNGVTGNVKSLDLTGGVTGAIGTLKLTWRPTYATIGGKCLRGSKREEVSVKTCETTGGFTSLYSSTGTTAGYKSVKLLFTNDTSYYTEGTKSLKMTAPTGISGGLVTSGLYFLTASSPLNLSGKTLMYDILYGNLGVANETYQSVSLETTFYSGATYNNSKTYLDVSDNGLDFTYNYWMTKAFNLATATPTHVVGTLQPSAITRIKLELTWDNATDVPATFYMDGVKSVDNTSGLCYATGNSGWTMVSDPYTPSEPKNIVVYDGRAFVFDDYNFYYSAVGDGTQYTQDSSSAGIDDGDGDKIKGARTLGRQLIAFKGRSIHRIKYTGDVTIPYRRDPVYSEGNRLDGVGISNASTIANISLGSGSDSMDAQSYLVFLGNDRKIYAIGEIGSAIEIGKRVAPRLAHLTDAELAYCHASYEPVNKMYLLWYPSSGSTTCANCLIYCTDSKAWSEFRLGNIDTSSTVSSGSQAYMLLSDAKYIYTWNKPATLALSNYADDVGGSTARGITAQWRSVHSAYGNPRHSKCMVDTELTVKGTSTDCPIGVVITNESNETSTASITTTSITAQRPEITTNVLNKLYGRYLSTEFNNKQINQSMDVLFWCARIKQSRGLK